MCASAIFRLALVSRFAMAGSATRNARAISAVLSPPSVRRVSATRAAGSSAGWQQVKISRSRSSGIVLSGAGAGCSCSSSLDQLGQSRGPVGLRAVAAHADRSPAAWPRW